MRPDRASPKQGGTIRHNTCLLQRPVDQCHWIANANTPSSLAGCHQFSILIDAEEALGRDPRLPRVSKCIVDVCDPINLYAAIHMAVPVNMNIRAYLPDLLLQQIRSQYRIKNSITLRNIMRHDIYARKEMRERNDGVARRSEQRLVHRNEIGCNLPHPHRLRPLAGPEIHPQFV